MKVGVSFQHTHGNGRELATRAMQSAGIETASLVFAFCGQQVDARSLFAEIRDTTGAPVIGGSAIGVITATDLGYQGGEVAVAVCELPEHAFSIAKARGVQSDPYGAGLEAGRALRRDTGPIVLFYDSVKRHGEAHLPPQIVPSPALLDGMRSGLGGNAHMVGAGLVKDMLITEEAEVFASDECRTDQLVACRFSDGLACEASIMHGCTPLDGIYYTVTRCEGDVLYELDGKPVAELIDNLYGDREWRGQRPLMSLTLGINHGDRFGEFSEENFVNRLIAGCLPDGSGVLMFEPDIEEGAEILFMLRNRAVMIRSARVQAETLVAGLQAAGRAIYFGLYIDCAGRAASLSNTEQEEAAVVASVFATRDLPFLGFYSGVEIAPLFGQSRGLDWTGVLVVFAEPA